MPDSARFISSLMLGLLGWGLSLLIMPLFPNEPNWGYFIWVNTALGAIIGWRVIGRRMGRGWTHAINMGITAAIALMFWGLAVQSFNEMMARAMRNRYRDPIEAFVAIFEIGLDWAITIGTVPVLAAAALGGVLAGLSAEAAWRIWR